jgi:hypothetical protein
LPDDRFTVKVRVALSMPTTFAATSTVRIALALPGSLVTTAAPAGPACWASAGAASTAATSISVSFDLAFIGSP